MPYPPNPDYGSGVFRRRIALASYQQQVNVDLEDCNHAFRLQLFHDNNTVTDIKAEAIRYPLSVCPGAVEALKVFVEKSLVDSKLQLRDLSDHRQQCTHLHDMLGLGMSMATSKEKHRVYDIELEDFSGSETTARVFCDEHLVHEWTISAEKILFPLNLKGRALYKGFSHWANEFFSGGDLEAAGVLQMGIFVAQGRRYNIDGMAGEPVETNRIPLGACYGFQPVNIRNAIRSSGSSRDFTESPELLLRFV